MIVYEVAVTVREDLCDAFERYMADKHVPEVLATGKFESASFEMAEVGRYRTRYLASTRDALEDYLAENAPALRDDFAAHFPKGVEVSRSEWSVVASLA